MGTCVAGGRLAGTLTLMAGVWLTGTLCCMNWAACCFCCCSRRSCSCICSRMSCCRSRIREVMLEELKGGLEAPGCSELLWEEQRETAQLPPVPSSLRVCRTVLGQGAESAGLRGTAKQGARSRPTAGTQQRQAALTSRGPNVSKCRYPAVKSDLLLIQPPSTRKTNAFIGSSRHSYLFFFFLISMERMNHA